ncbi:hypothetical protein ABLG96_18595 [Nakamurella sp. A5-74]|uniref:Exo-alpha-sialidase n=1 Tax=Nakamurella sp. A5-74 TaxID=3158264 RepID=A0AAU8DNF0_9ACTN
MTDPYRYPGTGATVVAPAPGSGPGNWSGAASAVVHDGAVYLTWRSRRPLADGRGVSVLVASSVDGVTFQEVCRIDRDAFGAESFERPALAFLPDGSVRIYLSCATRQSKHWWIDTLTAASVAQLPSGVRAIAVPGTEVMAVKDPVLWRQEADTERPWRMFVCCHPLTDQGEEDRMTSRLFSSADGLDWRDDGEVLRPTVGSWDARGARIAAVIPGGSVVPDVIYDGRPDADSNWFETSGLARWDGERYRPVPDLRWQSEDPAREVDPHGLTDAALRYASAVEFQGVVRWYAEAARPDGAHDLVTWTR